jgi:Uma2 family endonuclease
MQSRIDDYLKFGVPHIWLLDPGSRRAWVYTREGSREVTDGVLHATNPDVTLPLAEVFGEIDAH